MCPVIQQRLTNPIVRLSEIEQSVDSQEGQRRNHLGRIARGIMKSNQPPISRSLVPFTTDYARC